MHNVSADTYAQDVVDASRELPVLVDVWGPRCGPCLRMMPWVEQLAERKDGTVKIVKLDSSVNRHLCADMSIMGLPTVVLYRAGAEIARLSGDACTPSGIEALLAAHVG